MLKKLVQSTFNKFGYRIVRDRSLPDTAVSASAYGLEPFLFLLKRFGFNPNHIIDVGANKGTWTRRALQFFPQALYTLVEPQDHLKTHIQDLLDGGYKIKWINMGVADNSGFLPFTISNRDDASTFALNPADENDRRISVPVTTLNEIMSAASIPPPEMVKIDAEGFDLKVLGGASDMLGKTEISFVEVQICGTGWETTIARVIRRMDEAGYKVIDITDINRSPKYGVLWLCELAFLKNDSTLLDTVTSYE